MGRTKDKCQIDWCNKPRIVNNKKTGYKKPFCSTHAHNATIGRFLAALYKNMSTRVNGTDNGKIAQRNRHLYLGKPILPRDVFMTWAKNHPDFLSLYKAYFTSRFDRKLAPSINRMDSSKGYVLGNIEWMTNSQNCGLAGTVKKMNNEQRKVIYKLVGVK